MGTWGGWGPGEVVILGTGELVLEVLLTWGLAKKPRSTRTEGSGLGGASCLARGQGRKSLFCCLGRLGWQSGGILDWSNVSKSVSLVQ